MISNKIAFFRKKRGLTQGDIRAAIHKKTGKKFRQGTISSWENGKTAPDMELLNVLASILQVNVDDLYDKPNQDAASDLHKELLALFSRRLKEGEDVYKQGNNEEAYLRVKALSEEMLEQLANVSEDYQKLREKLKTVQQVINL